MCRLDDKCIGAVRIWSYRYVSGCFQGLGDVVDFVRCVQQLHAIGVVVPVHADTRGSVDDEVRVFIDLDAVGVCSP